MKISKKVKEELIRSTKSKKNGLNRSMNKKMVLEEEITILQSNTYVTRGNLTIILKRIYV